MKHFCIFLLAAHVCLGSDFSTGQAARLVIGQTTFTQSDEGATDMLIGAAGGIAYAGNRLFVADSNRFFADPVNNRVLIFPTDTLPKPTDVLSFPLPDNVPSGGTCLVCARTRANVILGQGDYNNNAVNLTQAGMRTPTAVASDGTHLVVADTDNNRILIWNQIPAAGSLGTPADVVVGQADFTHNRTAVPPTANSLRGPQGVWLQNGKLFVADTQNNRVLIFNSIPTQNNAAADVVLGVPNFTTGVPATQVAVVPTASNLTSPVSVTSDGVHLFITDLGANRVLIWNTIPTANGASADTVLGQPDMTSYFSNNYPALCASTGTDSNGNATYPARCSKTMSFPRYALSDGKRLFVADGGNDRITVYSNIPTTNGAAPDYILGEPDEFTDNAGDGADQFQTPTSLAWDGTNLYVADVFNRRIVAYSPGDQPLPPSGIRNAASREVFALGSVVVAGTITVDDTVTVTISNTDANGNSIYSKDYTYKVVTDDTLTEVTNGLVALINASPGDTYVTARPNIASDGTYFSLFLTAKVGSSPGTSIGLATTTSTNATETVTASGTNLSLDLQNAAQLAAGSLVTVFGTNLSDNSDQASFSGQYLPLTLANTQVYFDGIPAPLVAVTPTQINAQLPFEVQDRTSVTAFVRTVRADGTVSVTNSLAVPIVIANPGIFADEGSDPRPGHVYHAYANATALVSVDGSITAGDVGTLTIGDETFNYTVLSTDTLTTVAQAFVDLINADDNSPVTATLGNVFQRILLTAKQSGTDGQGVAIGASVSTNATLLLTALTTTTCCASQGGQVTSDNPAVPGEILYIYATGLGPSTNGVDTGKVVTDPNEALDAPVTPVDSILAGGSTANIITSGYVPGLVGVYQVYFQINSSLGSDPQTQLTIAQQYFVSNVVTFPVLVPVAQ